MVYWWRISQAKALLRIGLIFPAVVFSRFATEKDFYMNSDKYILEQLMVKKENTNLIYY
jgi:hypothetical protein